MSDRTEPYGPPEPLLGVPKWLIEVSLLVVALAATAVTLPLIERSCCRGCPATRSARLVRQERQQQIEEVIRQASVTEAGTRDDAAREDGRARHE